MRHFEGFSNTMAMAWLKVYLNVFFSPFLQPPSTIQENVTASPNGRVQDVDLPNRIANWSQCDKRAEICVPTLQLYFRNFLWTKKKMSFFLSFLFWCDTQKSFLYIKRNRKNSGVIINHSLLISVLKGISRRVLILLTRNTLFENSKNMTSKEVFIGKNEKVSIQKRKKVSPTFFINFSSHEENIP